jgi:hypothetical protein
MYYIYNIYMWLCMLCRFGLVFFMILLSSCICMYFVGLGWYSLWYYWVPVYVLCRFGLVFFMILLSSCICMWRSGYRERIIYFGTVPPSYSPLSHKEAHLQTVSTYHYTATDFYFDIKMRLDKTCPLPP